MAAEIERRFLVTDPPHAGPGETIRQGYLAVDHRAEVRVRRRGSSQVMTVKVGRGMEREEVEFDLDPEVFERLWETTEGRRVIKRRHEVEVGDRVAELDVFEGAHRGLVMVEVEFESTEAAAGFEPPLWFGAEVTDDERYGNASLALHGVPS